MPFYRVAFLFYFVMAIYTPVMYVGIGGGLHYLDALFFLSVFYIALYLAKRRRKSVRKLVKEVNFYSLRFLWLFLILALLYVLASFMNFIELFDIKHIYLKKSFIPRQSYFIFYSAIGIATAISIIRNSENFVKDWQYTSLILPVVLSVMIIYEYILNVHLASMRINSCFLPALVYYHIYKHGNFLSLIYLGLTSIILLSGGASSLLAFLVLLIFLLSHQKRIVNFFIKRWWLSIGLIILAFFHIFDNIVLVQAYDTNSYVRLIYWQDNFQTLQQTHFIGVGFGTPYASFDLLDRLNTLFVNVDKDPEFIIAQHSALVNVLYRLGALGFVFFMCLVILIFIETRRLNIFIKRLGMKKYVVNHIHEALLLGFINALLSSSINVGFASPYVFISFLMFMAFLIAFNVILTYQSKVYFLKKIKNPITS